MTSPVRRTACALAGVSLGVGALAGWPSAQQPGRPTLTVPDGFEVVRVAAPPLVERPIVADFDEDGRLYVAAPPSIWKLTDTDGDGVADVREEWFQGKTLTGCANDLHGPYLGPDGWIYWTKGAFAEQTYERPGQPPLVTKAAHVFRRRPGDTVVEPVLTGGMDNPVDVAFTSTGDRILTATFLEHPQLGKRDALAHAVYGGVYGKVHGVIDGHPRTGELLGPVC